jgi:hypothetical protein
MNDSEMVILYTEKLMPQNDIGRLAKRNSLTIVKILKNHDIKIRNSRIPKLTNVSKKKFVELYIDKKWSVSMIARKYKVGNTSVYRKLRKLDIPVRKIVGKANPHWKGGVTEWHGYIMVHDLENRRSNCNGYIKRAVFNMEKKLGRELKPEEIVHHIDRNKKNDNPENLMLCVDHSEHMKFHWEGM